MAEKYRVSYDNTGKNNIPHGMRIQLCTKNQRIQECIKIQECTKIRTQTHHRMTMMTVEINPVPKRKIQLMQQGMRMRMKTNMSN